jgi:TonB family protein
MMLLIETTVRVTVIVLLSLACAALLRRRAAAVRHWILAMGLSCAGVMPLLQAATPWSMPSASVQTLVSTAAAAVAIPQPLAIVSQTVRYPAIADVGWSRPRIVESVWAVGAIVGLCILGIGLLRLTWIAARAEPVIDPRWTDPFRDIAVRLHIRRDVLLLQSQDDRLLVTAGVWRPKIILPRGAAAWTSERIRVVLCHELSHVRRIDPGLHQLAAIVRSLYWFNPFVWVACRWLRQESERASDDDVMRLGTSGSDYASELLDIARALRPVVWSPAAGMARPSSLQRRVHALLNPTIDRRPLSWSRRVLIAAAALLAATVVAGSGAAAQALGSAFSGAFVDALNNAVPNVTFTLTNTATGENFTVRADADGRFMFEAVPDGEYRGLASAPGFTDTHPFFRISDGQSSQPSVIPLALGSIEETITVREAVDSDRGSARNEITGEPRASERLRNYRQRAQTAPLMPPLKVRDVRPLFPPSRTGSEATVFLTAIIDTNGFVKGLEVMQPADAEFGRAALDAIKEWQFEPTRLHGIAIDTSMHVTVRFLR